LWRGQKKNTCHRLAATRVVSQVIKKFQFEMPLQSLFAAAAAAESIDGGSSGE
jgi:hypothetical protein